jgi:hypothetical protein
MLAIATIGIGVIITIFADDAGLALIAASFYMAG